MNTAVHDHTVTARLPVIICIADEPRERARLASSPGRLWAYQQLHEDAWDDAYFTGPAAVQSVVKRLRALRQAGLPLNIEAARGVGFRLTIGTDLHLVHPVRAPR